ncbi:MAG: magnesium transporter [Candidatus Rokuibacteriota bacterium]|nr:MAG: magnesium transporter [Candidatus Rokubacteria bacterium]
MTSGQDPSSWRALGSLVQVGMTFVVCTVLGLASGYWADQWLATSPWLLLLGLGFGVGAGFVNLFRSVRDAERREQPDDRR